MDHIPLFVDLLSLRDIVSVSLTCWSNRVYLPPCVARLATCINSDFHCKKDCYVDLDQMLDVDQSIVCSLMERLPRDSVDFLLAPSPDKIIDFLIERTPPPRYRNHGDYNRYTDNLVRTCASTPNVLYMKALLKALLPIHPDVTCVEDAFLLAVRTKSTPLIKLLLQHHKFMTPDPLFEAAAQGHTANFALLRKHYSYKLNALQLEQAHRLMVFAIFKRKMKKILKRRMPEELKRMKFYERPGGMLSTPGFLNFYQGQLRSKSTPQQEKVYATIVKMLKKQMKKFDLTMTMLTTFTQKSKRWVSSASLKGLLLAIFSLRGELALRMSCSTMQLISHSDPEIEDMRRRHMLMKELIHRALDLAHPRAALVRAQLEP